MSRHSPKEIERIKRVASKMTIVNPAQFNDEENNENDT